MTSSNFFNSYPPKPGFRHLFNTSSPQTLQPYAIKMPGKEKTARKSPVTDSIKKRIN
jgi:hypothetical protein